MTNVVLFLAVMALTLAGGVGLGARAARANLRRRP